MEGLRQLYGVPLTVYEVMKRYVEAEVTFTQRSS